MVFLNVAEIVGEQMNFVQQVLDRMKRDQEWLLRGCDLLTVNIPESLLLGPEPMPAPMTEVQVEAGYYPVQNFNCETPRRIGFRPW